MRVSRMHARLDGTHMRWGDGRQRSGQGHAMEQDAHDMHEVGWNANARWMGHMQGGWDTFQGGWDACKGWMGCMQGGWDSHEVGEGRQKSGGMHALRQDAPLHTEC